MRILALMTLDRFRLALGWALESIGHQVWHLNELSEALLEEAIAEFQPDVLFAAGWDSELRVPSKLEILAKVLQRHKLFHVYFAEEDSLHFERWSSKYVQQVRPQLVLTRSRACVPLYREEGVQAAFFDVGCNPELHRPFAERLSFSCEVSVVANAQLSWRIFRRKSIADLVVPLLDQHYEMKIWGEGWDACKRHFGLNPPARMLQGVLPYHETPRVYQETKINISLQSQEEQISNRTYDILASGGFLLTSDTPAVREFLRPGVEGEISNSPTETLEKVKYYLAHEEQRQRIAGAGRELAEKKAAYQKTLPIVWRHVEQALHEQRRRAEHEFDTLG